MISKLITISGRVQGVGFRFSARNKAKELDIKGYAKNLPNGSVEILAQGVKLKEFIEWCKTGPSTSHIDTVVLEDVESTARLEFKVI